MDPVYGIDTSILAGPGGTPGLDGTFAEISDADVLLEDAYKTVTCPAGALWWDPFGTIDLRALLLDSLSESERTQLERTVSALFEEDPRLTVACSITYLAGTLTATLIGTAKTGETFSITITPGDDVPVIQRAA